MNTKIENYLKDIEYKDKVISYLKNIYKIEVGEEASIPDAYMLDKNKDPKILNKEILITFEDKVNSLNLPDPNDKTLKQKIAKLKKSGDTNFLITSLDLSGYADKGITVDLLKKVVDSMKALKTVEWLDLRNNNLDDSYSQLIIDLLGIDTLKRIDISHNNFNKVAAKKIANILKQVKHLEYFDISFNPIKDESVCINLCSAAKFHAKLFHFGISDLSKDAGLKLLNAKSDIRSINLDDSTYKPKVYEYFYKILADKKYSLAVLSLKFNNIDMFGIHSIERGLRVNKTLVYLSLYNCGVNDVAGERIFSAIENNKYLIELDVGKNLLSTRASKALSKLLRLNNILKTINISRNNLITNDDFTLILEGLVNNPNITSLGNLADLKIGARLRDSAEMILNLNKKYTNNEITLDLSKSQKQEALKISIDFEKYRKTSLESSLIPKEINSEIDIDNALISKYDIKFLDDEFEFFNFN
jgi:hypothetical protein